MKKGKNKYPNRDDVFWKSMKQMSWYFFQKILVNNLNNTEIASYILFYLQISLFYFQKISWKFSLLGWKYKKIKNQ